MQQPVTLPYCLLLTALFFSCETLHKTPASRSTKRPATTTSARKPPYSKPTTAPTRPRPAGPYDQNVRDIVRVARTYTGTPYRSGGNDKGGIDCSGLICSVYTEVGFKVPRISWQQSEFGREVQQVADIRPGDWLFFVPDAGKEGYVSHAGIVTEVRGRQEVLFIHASSSRGVREDNLYSNYFKNRFVKAIRPF
ncbi:C40 family peptidase [Telluribacter sp.]|jgi:cell wall-associated NlpC family hydrolase|uniref:C40 family peptidase n=1 Tax=Telluribacter sp. TaxID=1978767 RepID=UPI002E15061B|nr:C40 family peptidase [Telluribacter sp.]